MPAFILISRPGKPQDLLFNGLHLGAQELRPQQQENEAGPGKITRLPGEHPHISVCRSPHPLNTGVANPGAGIIQSWIVVAVIPARAFFLRLL